MVISKYPVLVCLIFGLITGFYVVLSLNDKTLAAIVCGGCLGIGAVFSFTGNFRKEKRRNFIYNFKDDAGILYNGSAGHFKDDTPVNGKLYLLPEILVFQTNSSHRQIRYETILQLDEVKEVSFAKTHHVNGKLIVIVTRLGEERFLVRGNQLWIDEIENALHRITSARKSM